MGRIAKEILGTVSNVSDVQEHKGQFRVRYYLNGVLSESTRAKKEDAEALRKSLVIRAETAGTGPAQALQATSLSTARLRAAELAFTALEANGLVSGDTEVNRIVDAVTLFISEAKKLDAGVSMTDAYAKFLERCTAKGISPKTMKDYRRFVAPFIEQHSTKNVGQITGLQCKDWVYSFPEGGPARFNCWGYLEAFFGFCGGKNNPHCDREPWIKLSPVRSFEKPPYTVGDIQSFNYDETVKVLKRAQEKRCLPYFIFRFFSMMRREEMARFLSHGDLVQNNDLINTRDGSIRIPPDVAAQKGKAKNKGRVLNPVHPTFNAWLRYFSQNKLSLAVDQNDADQVTNCIRSKADAKNIVRHTACTMRLKSTGDIVTTAREAGNTPKMITDHYLALHVTKDEAHKFYELTPDKAKELGIL